MLWNAQKLAQVGRMQNTEKQKVLISTLLITDTMEPP